MKFRTEIFPAPITPPIDHTRRGFSVGSCFADRIAERLAGAKFTVTSNPTGVLYNPASIADLLESNPEGLREADYVLVTFGTAWVYELDGRVVANCGRRSASMFTRRRLEVEEIVERFDALMNGGEPDSDGGETDGGGEKPGPLAGKQVIFTVSPIRHLKDGFEENSLSKATLRLAAAQIVERHAPRAAYFPAFEALTDDLRDYRFYGADLAHPSDQAVEYIWEKFAAAALSPQARELMEPIENIVRATRHRPFDPGSEEHRKFRTAMLAQARRLAATHPEVDLSAEIKFFS